MSDQGNYSRVYWTLVDDEKFENVYDDDASFAAWVRLLMIADQAWPASAHLPANCRQKAVKILAGAGIIALLTGGRYRVVGLDAERDRRAGEQTNGGRVRARTGQRGPNGRYLPSSGGTSGGDQRWKPSVESPATSLDETRRDETRRADARDGGGDDAYDRVVAWLASRKAWVDSPKIATDLARMVDRKGAPAVIAAMEQAIAEDGAEIATQMIYGARNRLFPFAASRVQPVMTRAERESLEAKRQLGLETA